MPESFIPILILLGVAACAGHPSRVTDLATGRVYYTDHVRRGLTTGNVYFKDAKTGAEIWRYDPKVPREWGPRACCDVVNRGVAVYRGRVYVGTLDGRLVALDAATLFAVEATPKGGSVKTHSLAVRALMADGTILPWSFVGENVDGGWLAATGPRTALACWTDRVGSGGSRPTTSRR